VRARSARISLAAEVDKDPRFVEVGGRRQNRGRCRAGLLIVEHRLALVHGPLPGHDHSNAAAEDGVARVLLLSSTPTLERACGNI